MALAKLNFQMTLPPYVKKAYNLLRENEFVTYVVGGSVRDSLLGIPTKDFDLATSATPDQILKIFPEGLEVGRAFGVIKIPISRIQPDHTSPEQLLEIATFRKDLGYVDHRHPKGVEFLGPEEDAKRRDFTVNGLFFDPSTQMILDYVGGLRDLKEKVLRSIGQAPLRFREDALRLMRAIRFTASLGFVLESRTAKGIESNAALIRKISMERVRDEFTKMLLGPRPSVAIRLMRDLGLLSHTIPELNALAQIRLPKQVRLKPWEQTLRFFDLFAENPRYERSEAIAWAGMCAYLGKIRPATEGLPENAKIAKDIGNRLRWSRDLIERVQKLLIENLKFKEVFEMREARIARWIREPHFEDCLELHRLLAMSGDGDLAAYEFCRGRFQDFQGESKPLLSGDDLVELGLKPGKRFSEILNAIEDLRLEGRLQTKEEALEHVLKIWVR